MTAPTRIIMAYAVTAGMIIMRGGGLRPHIRCEAVRVRRVTCELPGVGWYAATEVLLRYAKGHPRHPEGTMFTATFPNACTVLIEAELPRE